MADKHRPAADGKEAKDAKKGEPPPPTTGYFLELYFPMTRAILPQHCLSEGDAVRAAYDHFGAFPSGYAQIRECATNKVVLNHQQLFMRYKGRAR